MDMGNLLVRLKRRLSIEDDLQDEVLKDIIDESISHFKLITGASEVEDRYAFIILDVSDIRYNRRGSAGLISESVDGYSANFSRMEDDFAPYMPILKREFDIDNDENKGKKGKVMWY
ncbi:phage head-tail connector protein [Anaerococcus sp. AGMB09787]|uniref:phage head-tail connector protein n=1 Tax=Anaerococcus sp. AGMB09787 TaxID=2922869 RepID=UPI001FB040E4|nr:phage head-tail connector protein [Anaerococcus sp. AGMB09787]